jgi:hypothetical protein
VNRLLKFFGIVLLLGGLGHFVGVTHLYITAGIPEANRVLLDIWIGEAQLLGGSLYLAASRESWAGKGSRALAVFGALTIIGFSVPMIPVLLARAPILFRIPVAIYFVLSIFVLVQIARQKAEAIG